MSLLNDASLIITPNAVKEGKLYSIIPSNGNGDMTVVRATTATRVNSLGLIESVAANVLRLNYDVAGGCPSILVEPQRTNLVTYSEMFSTVWATTDLNTSGTPAYINQGISPDNALTADKIIPNNLNAVHRFIAPTITVVSGSAYTLSVFMKKNDFDFCFFRENINGVTDNTFFNLSTITLGTVASGRTAKIENYGNGWIRCSVTATTTTTSLTVLGIGVTDTNGNIATIGDNVKFNFLWGAQLEAGSYATSYIPTIGSAVTRNADGISKTGISGLIGQTEGIVFIDFQNKVNEVTTGVVVRMLFTITDGTINNRISLAIVKTATRNYTDITIRSNSVTVSNINVDTLIGRFKIAVSYKTGATKIFINGLLVLNVGLSQVPITDRLFLGCSTSSGGENANVGINNFLTEKTALTDSECIALTTL